MNCLSRRIAVRTASTTPTRRSRYLVTTRTQMLWDRFVGAAFNLVWMAKLALGPPAKVAAC